MKTPKIVWKDNQAFVGKELIGAVVFLENIKMYQPFFLSQPAIELKFLNKAKQFVEKEFKKFYEALHEEEK